MTLKDAEFLDSRKFSIAEIARWFGVPPHMVGDVERSTSWGTGIEQQGLHFLIYSLLPWIELIEQSIRFSLVVQSERYYPKFNVNAILRMDAKAQADVFAILIENGVLNPNECRDLLDRNPRDGGDKYADPSMKVLRPTPPQDRQPPPDQQPPPDGAAAAQALDVARSLAAGRASDLLTEESRALAKLAKEHARSPDVWPSAVAGFYGRFAGRVAVAMACDKTAAKGWCETRRGLVLADGMVGLTDKQQSQAADALIALALTSGGSSPC
jgi:hypothetical protein